MKKLNSKLEIRNWKVATATIIIFVVSPIISADTHYVSKIGGSVSPYASWSTAATNIQAAVDVASSGDTVLVNDGTYYPGNQISVTNDITIKSVNGATNTVVNGSGSHSCFYLNYKNATIDGFIITNGFAYNGGGVYSSFRAGIVQNCIIRGNSAESTGGGVFSYNGTVLNCIVSGNSADDVAGGVFCRNGLVQNCTIIGNLAADDGGGIYCMSRGRIQNCTIIGNAASVSGGGLYCQSYGGTVQNSILWNNTNGNFFDSNNSNLYNCIENWSNLVNGIITNNPQFISDTDYRLQSTSPCRNSGLNEQYVFDTFDLDGNSRIMGATVDMGAYEYVESFQWPPSPAPQINDSAIDFGKISWTPTISEIPRAENFVVQELLGTWSTIYTGTNTNLLIQRLSNTYYRVAAHNSVGYSEWSTSVFYNNYPINVTSLNAEQLTDGSGYVSIQSRITDQNLDLSELKVEYSLDNGASWANGDPFLVAITQSNQTPSINNFSEFQITNVLPDNSTLTILWDTVSAQNGGGSLANQKIEQAKIRITPKNAYSTGYSYNSLYFEIDNSPILNYWIAINHNDLTTTSPNVSLQLNAEGSLPLYMRISNGTDFGNSPWQSYTNWVNWTLSPASGTKTVYVQYKNEKGYIVSAQTSIILNNIDYTNFEGTNDITFLMGRNGSVSNEASAHTVNITTAAMYKTEISNLEFVQFISEGGYFDNSYWSTEGWAWRTTKNVVCPLNWNTNDTPNYANDPYSNSDIESVVGISYYEAEAYCNWANYELPTEAQWEYFAKNGDERYYPWASNFWYTSSQPNYYFCNWKIGFEGFTENGYTNDGSEFANCVTNYSDGKGHCGHYNLSGNVAEWVKDWYGTYGAVEETDPEGPANGTERVVRGGSFVHGRDDLSTTRRMHYLPEFRTNWLGMRVAKNDIVPEPIGFLIFNFLFLIYYFKRNNRF